MQQNFIFPVRVYYEDTDAGGVVYHANYIKFMARARAEMMRTLGFPLEDLAKEGYIIVVRRVELDYFKPAKLGDLLEVVTTLIETNDVKFIFRQDICLAENHKVLFCQGIITVVSINKNFRPCRFHSEALQAISNTM